MSIINDRSKICKIYHGAVEICKVYHSDTLVFGCAQPPTVLGVVREYPGGVYQYTQADFTNNFSDPDGDSSLKVIIDQLPSIGEIRYNGTPITAGFEFNLVDVGNLTFQLLAGYTVANGGYCIDGDGCYSLSRIKTIFRVSDDSTDQLYSNQATMALAPVSSSSAPTVSDNTGTLSSKEFTFAEASFTNNFADADGDTYKDVIIADLPNIGELKYNGVAVSPEDKIPATDAANLKYTLPDTHAIYQGALYSFPQRLDTIIANQKNAGYYLTYNVAGTLKFTNNDGDVVEVVGTQVAEDIQIVFAITDDSTLELESETATFTLNPSGNVNVKALYVNQPPTVGDNTISTNYNITKKLTQRMFIDDTDPRFSDPENNQPFQLEVVTLPAYGKLQLNGVDITAGAILDFGTDITEQESTTNFTYVPDATRTDIQSTKFSFRVSDTGSQTFAG